MRAYETSRIGDEREPTTAPDAAMALRGLSELRSSILEAQNVTQSIYLRLFGPFPSDNLHEVDSRKELSPSAFFQSLSFELGASINRMSDLRDRLNEINARLET